MEMIKKGLVRGLLYFSAAIFLLIFGYPFIFVLFTSFKDQSAYISSFWGPPQQLFFGNFQAVFKMDFLIYFANSLFVATVSVVMSIFIGSLASYAIATMKFKLSGAVFLLFLLGMMIPVHTTLIPIYTLTRQIHMLDSIFGLIGPYISFSIPISVYIMTSFFKEVPKSILESAEIDGASPFRSFISIMMPLSKSAISTIGIFNFLYCWNEFIFSLTLINSTSQKTLPLGIREFYGMETVNIPGVITAILIGSLPVIIFYFFAQEQVIRGLSSGAVKE
jgi:raffinose/stachyose/melibiose transport system permease protein